MLNEIAKQQLKKAGWYEGRKIDITEQVKFLENLGYEVFDAAKKFMEEYGELDICDRFIGYKNSIGESHNTTCIKDLFAHIPNREIEKYDLDEEVGQKTIPVIIFSGEVYVYVAEDGKFYRELGLLSESSDEIWNDNYGDVSHFLLRWDEIAEGKTIRINYSPAHKGREYL